MQVELKTILNAVQHFPGFVSRTVQSSFAQHWDASGRRSELSQISAGSGGLINYAYQADGSLTGVTQGGNHYAFTYANNGLLASRSNPWRMLTINQRDGQGRLEEETATVGGSSVFTENLFWQANSKLSNYTAIRTGASAWNDTAGYQGCETKFFHRPPGHRLHGAALSGLGVHWKHHTQGVASLYPGLYYYAPSGRMKKFVSLSHGEGGAGITGKFCHKERRDHKDGKKPKRKRGNF